MHEVLECPDFLFIHWIIHSTGICQMVNTEEMRKCEAHITLEFVLK